QPLGRSGPSPVDELHHSGLWVVGCNSDCGARCHSLQPHPWERQQRERPYAEQWASPVQRGLECRHTARVAMGHIPVRLLCGEPSYPLAVAVESLRSNEPRVAVPLYTRCFRLCTRKLFYRSGSTGDSCSQRLWTMCWRLHAILQL